MTKFEMGLKMAKLSEQYINAYLRAVVLERTCKLAQMHLEKGEKDEALRLLKNRQK